MNFVPNWRLWPVADSWNTRSNAYVMLSKPFVSNPLILIKAYRYAISVGFFTSGFNSTYLGFRFTVLDPDTASFKMTMSLLAQAIRHYFW